MSTITENYDIVINERGGLTLKRTIDDIANSAQKAAEGVGRLSNSSDGFVSSLKKQADTLGFGRAQLLSYDAAQLKLNASQKASVDASIKQIAAFDKAQDAARKNVDVLGSLKGQLVGAAAAYLSFTGVIAGGRAILDAAIANERLMNTLTVGVGSIQAATKEHAFLRQESDRLGLQFVTTAEQYAKLAAASKGTQLEGQATRDIFLAIAQASTVLGLSADQTGGALLAIQQMISKGKVSAEELRGQLGERLPGAFQIAARAIGVTTAELDKMLETGQV
ncbi:MAG: tape measure protein [Nitrosomonas sp.]|nr:tape measure protein [Nitrosomonas sp.]